MSSLHRRDVLRRLAYGLAAVPLLQACGGDNLAPDVDSPAGMDSSIDPEGWASGGTAAMTAKASYPDPFTVEAASCLLIGSTTAGPCTTATDLAREDVSEGLGGLPVRLGLRVVDASCEPLVGATVRIWHTNTEGSYSGQTPNNAMCLLDQAYAVTNFMRGVQVTDGRGIAYFDTCFPGSYPGRAIHIHFQIEVGGASTRVSQLFFPEDITEGVFASHPDYSSFGQPSTTLTNDGVIAGLSGAERARMIFEVARMSDGAMLASKTVTVTA
jgi:protocatechuate 3,4-dioxygenase beta subunit